MIRTVQLRKMFSLILVAVALLLSTMFGDAAALAAGGTNSSGAAPYPKGESTNINGSYHQLQQATQDYRNQLLDDYSDRFVQADKTANTNRSPLKKGSNPLRQQSRADQDNTARK